MTACLGRTSYQTNKHQKLEVNFPRHKKRPVWVVGYYVRIMLLHISYIIQNLVPKTGPFFGAKCLRFTYTPDSLSDDEHQPHLFCREWDYDDDLYRHFLCRTIGKKVRQNTSTLFLAGKHM